MTESFNQPEKSVQKHNFITPKSRHANLHEFMRTTPYRKFIHTLMNAVVDAVVVVSPDGLVQLVNATAEKMFGYDSADEITGQKINKLMTEKYAGTFDVYMRHYRITGQNHASTLRKEIKCVRKSGASFYVEFSVSEIKQGNEIVFVAVLRDLTEIKNYQYSLQQHIEELQQNMEQLNAQAIIIRESESLMRGILDNAAEAIIMTDRMGMISSFNIAAEQMFGFHRYEVIGSNVSMLMPKPYNIIHDRYVAQHHESALRESIGLGREAIAVRKDGTQFPVFLSLSETITEQNVIFTGIIRDLTQQKRLEKETLTRTLLEQKNKEITDSIRYAFQIQMAILPEKAILNKYMPDHFVFYRPKDIVSGDFYWFSRKEDKIFIAAIDCTGHGVPGAFMSLIGYTNLNKIVDEFGVTEPDVILASLDRYVTQSLQKNSHNADFKEGMDMALCCIDTKTNVVTYSGAFRPMYVKRGSGQIEEIFPNKNSIGGYLDTMHTPKEFTAHRLQLQKRDIFYIFTDGITDQFGGSEAKKYSSRRFKEFLQSISNLPMEAQGLSLETEFDRWRSGQSQVDDVLVIGVQI